MEEQRAILPTGIPSLDTLLGGGLPARQALVVTGTPGTGKTILCSQIAFAHAARGLPVLVATVTSEPHDKLLAELSSFDFFDPERIGEELVFISAYPWLKQGAKETRDMLLRSVRERGAKVLFIDGLRSIRDLWQDEARLREFMYDLSVGLAAADCTAIFTTEYDIDQLLAFPEATTVDGIVSLTVRRAGPHRRRRIEVVKLRGRAHLPGEHYFEISKSGVAMFPRLETTTRSDANHAAAAGRASFGLPELDTLLHGGLPRESSTLIIGSTGIGKTLLSLHFAGDGAAHGEKTVFLSFYEPPRSLIARAAQVGLDLERHVAAQTIAIEYLPPLEREADQLAQRILEKIDAMGAKRLVIDGISELERSIADESRIRDFLVAFIIELRVRHVTTIFTREISQLAGSELDLAETATSLIAENLLFLRHVELRGRLHRLISILKMRSSDYDTNLREFEITKTGVRVLEPVRSAAGLLLGVAQPIPERD